MSDARVPRPPSERAGLMLQGRGLRARVLPALAATLAVALGCDAPEGEIGLIPLKVGFTKNLTMTPLFVAEAEGFFRDEGLDVELVAVETAATAIPALLQGRLDVLPGPMSPSLFNAIRRGGRLRLVADKGSYASALCAHQAFVVSPVAYALADPPVLRRVGTAKEPFFQFFVERALRELGHDPVDIELYHVPQAAEFQALVDGGLDAAMVGEPWLTRILRRGGVALTYTNETLDGHQYSVIAFGPNLLDRNPDAGRRFAVAMLRAVRRYNEGKTPTNRRIMHEALGYDEDLLSDICWPTMRDDGRIDAESIVEFQRWAMERGDLDGIVEPDAFWDARFMEHAAAVLDSRAAGR